MGIFTKKSFIFIYGPPGSGKSTIGKQLANSLGLPFCDLDDEIELVTGIEIIEIFQIQGEAKFRDIETKVLKNLLLGSPKVIALGGGSLCDPQNRSLVENYGQVVCLYANHDILCARLKTSKKQRPLLGSTNEINSRLSALLERRQDHYSSFTHILDNSNLSIEETTWQIQIILGLFVIRGLTEDCHINIKYNGLSSLGEQLRSHGWTDRIIVVSDSNVAPIYSAEISSILEKSGFHIAQETFPAGEKSKTPQNCSEMWNRWLGLGIDRSSGVIALGGGVVCDQVGFAASTYMRGIHWAAIPTSLLAIVDASIGGKTGINLSQVKNLIGSFHPPAVVIADPSVLGSLPVDELRNGMAEIVKSAIIADPYLFNLCDSRISGLQFQNFDSNLWMEVIKRAIAVKVHFVQIDPLDKDQREVLNLGHTLGHALEKASDFRLRHGEAIAIGLVCEACLSVKKKIADEDLPNKIRTILDQLGLPSTIPDFIDRDYLVDSIRYDKKAKNGKIIFSLPIRIGEVKIGVVIDHDDLKFLEEV